MIRYEITKKKNYRGLNGLKKFEKKSHKKVKLKNICNLIDYL